MSEPTPTGAAAPAKIDFEHASFAEPDRGHVACGACQRPIATEYWQYLGKVLCAECRDAVERSAADARRGATLGKAFLYAGAVALGCGIGYAIFAGLTKIHFALVTIGIGYVVGRSVQKVTRGFGARRHQVLAVALTYFASSMGYLPAVISGLRSAAHDTRTTDGAKASEGTPPAPAEGASTATAETAPASAEAAPAPTPEAPSAGGFLVALVAVVAIVTGITLAAPFLEIAGGEIGGLLGLAIIFFGLRTAWRVSKGVDAPITGPHQIAGS